MRAISALNFHFLSQNSLTEDLILIGDQLVNAVLQLKIPEEKLLQQNGFREKLETMAELTDDEAKAHLVIQ